MGLYNVHEARFENINKDTLAMSKNKRILANVAYMPHVEKDPVFKGSPNFYYSVKDSLTKPRVIGVVSLAR